MNKENKTQEKFIAAYETLSPLEKTLLHLCSVIYEPTNRTTLFKCLRRTGTTFTEERITTPDSLGLSLMRLQELNLVDDHFQCNELFVEIVTRRALAYRRIFHIKDTLKYVESESAWSDRHLSGDSCLLCQGVMSGPALKTTMGFVCLSCIHSQLRIFSEKSELEGWAVSQFKEALSPDGGIGPRLMVLWRFQEVRSIIREESPSEIHEILVHLVRNLGYVKSHPLSQSVRQAAYDTCIALGNEILPLLLDMSDSKPWQLYANIVVVAGIIDPHSEEVQALLEKAVRNPDPEVRKRLIYAIFPCRTPFAKKIFKTLTRDRDPSVRNFVEKISARDRVVSAARQQRRDAPITLGYYEALAKAVQEEIPLTFYHYSTTGFHGSSSRYSRLLMRDLRIAIYTENFDQYNQCYQRIMSRRTETDMEYDPLVIICNNPFDKDWFSHLPVALQTYSLYQIFYHAILYNEDDGQALTYALDRKFQNTIPKKERQGFYNQLISRLLIGGRLVEAKKLISQIHMSHHSLGLMGWVSFIEGKNDEAMSMFDSDLKELRRRNVKRTSYYKGIKGLFVVLALLKSHDYTLLEKTQKLIDEAISYRYGDTHLISAYSALLAITYFQNSEPDTARSILELDRSEKTNISILFSAIASYWIDIKLSRKKVAALSQVFAEAKNIGLHWPAIECAELLCRTGQEQPLYREYADKVAAETGIQSFVSSIQVEEPWRRSLQALINVASSRSRPSAKSPEKRLVWLINCHDSGISLHPKEQKRSAKGTWTQGRSVALSRLYSGEKLEYITKQDHVIRATIEKDAGYYRNPLYGFNWEKTLPALVGHPLLFLFESPKTSVEVVKGQPEVIIEESKSGFNIRFSPCISDEPVVTIQETPTRFTVIELCEDHRRIARILGDDGIQVPASSKDEVMTTITGISSLVTVHSTIFGRSEDIEEIEADPGTHVHLFPSGSGFKLEMFVKPFGEGGPYLKPGTGAENVIAEIDGKRMQAKRNLNLEEKKAMWVEEGCPTLSAFTETDRRWYLDEPEDCLEALLDLKILQEHREVSVAWPEGEKLRVTRQASFEQLNLKIRSKTDWFELSGQLDLDNNLVIGMKELMDRIQATDSRFIPLEDGQFIALTRELRRRLEELNLFSQRRGKTIRLHPFAAMAAEDFIDKIPDLDADETWQLRRKQIKDALELTPSSPSTLKAELRDYQVEGYRWLTRLGHMGVGGCLADDMGLGKTLQALAVILDRASQGPAIVVSPASVVMNWVTEANRFTPTLNITVFGGNNREALVKELKAFDMLVVSYGLLQQEAELLASHEWHTIVLDEGQAIKNITTKRSQAAMNLQGDFKFITTGTPIENHLHEFFTLFNFINPGLLGSRKQFNARFAVPIERHNDRKTKKQLQKLIRPFILRRIKSHVLDELPPKTEIILHVEMTPEETAFYEALRQQAVERLEQEEGMAGQKHVKILAEIMKLRRACCNPRLVVPESDLPSSKLNLFAETVAELLENRHKALIFSQFVGHLTLIRELLDSKNIEYRYLDGGTSLKERKRQVDAFQTGKGDLFLISLKAGGLGLNLTAADYVIHMDPWWNPAVEDQASDRAHRIGQEHPVTIYRLVTKNTIEEKIVKLHQKKRALADSLLDGSDMSGKVSAEELFQLIREQ